MPCSRNGTKRSLRSTTVFKSRTKPEGKTTGLKKRVLPSSFVPCFSSSSSNWVCYVCVCDCGDGWKRVEVRGSKSVRGRAESTKHQRNETLDRDLSRLLSPKAIKIAKFEAHTKNDKQNLKFKHMFKNMFKHRPHRG